MYPYLKLIKYVKISDIKLFSAAADKNNRLFRVNNRLFIRIYAFNM